MIRGLVDYALNNRFLILAIALLLLIWGAISFHSLPVEAYPVDWRTRGVEDAWRPFPTLAEGLRRTDTAVREWAGLVIYWLSGRSSELFPGPSARE